MTTSGYAKHLGDVANALAQIDTLEGFQKSSVVDAKIARLLKEAATSAQKAFFLLDSGPVSVHVARGLMDHLAEMNVLYGSDTP